MAVGKPPQPIGSTHQAWHTSPWQNLVLAKHHDRQARIDEGAEDRGQ
jgi:hypothetical protein